MFKFSTIAFIGATQAQFFEMMAMNKAASSFMPFGGSKKSKQNCGKSFDIFEVDDGFDMLDTNGDEQITFLELYNVAKKEVGKLGSGVEKGDVTTMGKLFKLVDTDNNGSVDK